jgi:hypothetical protein
MKVKTYDQGFHKTIVLKTKKQDDPKGKQGHQQENSFGKVLLKAA